MAHTFSAAGLNDDEISTGAPVIDAPEAPTRAPAIPNAFARALPKSGPPSFIPNISAVPNQQFRQANAQAVNQEQRQQNYSQRLALQQQRDATRAAEAAAKAREDAIEEAVKSDNKAALQNQNNVNEAKFTTAGVKTYTDANSKIQPRLDPLTGKPQRTDDKGAMQWDAAGRAFQVNRKDGITTQEFPDAKAKLVKNPNDTLGDRNLYRENANAPWEPVTPEQALLSDDPAEKSAGAGHLKAIKLAELKKQQAVLKASKPGGPELPTGEEAKSLRLTEDTPDLDPVTRARKETLRKHDELDSKIADLDLQEKTLDLQPLEDFSAEQVKAMGKDQQSRIKNEQTQTRLANLARVEKAHNDERAALEAEQAQLAKLDDGYMDPAFRPTHEASKAALGVKMEAWDAKNGNLQTLLQKEQARQEKQAPGEVAAKPRFSTVEQAQAAVADLAKDETKLAGESAKFTDEQKKLAQDVESFTKERDARMAGATTNAEILAVNLWQKDKVSELKSREAEVSSHGDLLQSVQAKKKENFDAKRRNILDSSPATKGVAGELEAVESRMQEQLQGVTGPAAEAVKIEAQRSQNEILNRAANQEQRVAENRDKIAEFEAANRNDGKQNEGYEDNQNRFLKQNGITLGEYYKGLEDHAKLTEWNDPNTTGKELLKTSDSQRQKYGAGLSAAVETGFQILDGTLGKLVRKIPAVQEKFQKNQEKNQDVVRRTSTGQWAFNPFMGWEEDKIMGAMDKGLDGKTASDADKAAVLKQVHDFQAKTAGPMLDAVRESSQFQDWWKTHEDSYKMDGKPVNFGLQSVQGDVLRDYLKSDDAKSAWNWIKTTAGDVYDRIKNTFTGIGAGVGSKIFGTDGAYNPDLMLWDQEQQQAQSQAMEIAGQKGFVNELAGQAASIVPALAGGLVGRAVKGASAAMGSRVGVALGDAESAALRLASSTSSKGLSLMGRKVADMAGKGYDFFGKSAAKWADEIGMGGSTGTAGLQSYAQGFQSAYKAYRDQGMSAEDAANKAQGPAVLMGLSTALVMTATGATGVESVFAKGEPTVRTLFKKMGGAGGFIKAMKSKEVRAYASSLFKHGAGEGWSEAKEETIDQGLQGLVEMATYNPDKTITELASDMGAAGFWGGLLGVAVPGAKGAASAAVNMRGDYKADKEGFDRATQFLGTAVPKNAVTRAIHDAAPSAVIAQGMNGHAAGVPDFAEVDAKIAEAQKAVAVAAGPQQQAQAHEQLEAANEERLQMLHGLAGTAAIATPEQVQASQDELSNAENPQDAAIVAAAVKLHQSGPQAMDAGDLAALGIERDAKGTLKAKEAGPDGLPRVQFTAEGKPIFTQTFLNGVSGRFPATAEILPKSETAQRVLKDRSAVPGLPAEEKAPKGEAPKTPKTPAEAAAPASESTQQPEWDVTVDGQKKPIRITAANEADALRQVAQMGKGMVRDVEQVATQEKPMNQNPSDSGSEKPVSPDGAQGEPGTGVPSNPLGERGGVGEPRHETKADSTKVASPGMPHLDLKAALDDATRAAAKAKGQTPTQKQLDDNGKMAVQLAKTLTRWRNVFPGVEIVPMATGAGVQTSRKNRNMEIDFSKLASTAQILKGDSGKWAELAVQEEVIHAVGVMLEKAGKWDAVTLFKALPDSVKSRVRKGYKGAESDFNLGHEFMRMLLQNRLNKGLLTELAAGGKGLNAEIRKALQALLDFFRDIAKSLKKEGAAPETIALVNSTADAIQALMAELDAENQSPETPKTNEQSQSDKLAGNVAGKSPEPVAVSNDISGATETTEEGGKASAESSAETEQSGLASPDNSALTSEVTGFDAAGTPTKTESETTTEVFQSAQNAAREILTSAMREGRGNFVDRSGSSIVITASSKPDVWLQITRLNSDGTPVGDQEIKSESDFDDAAKDDYHVGAVLNAVRPDLSQAEALGAFGVPKFRKPVIYEYRLRLRDVAPGTAPEGFTAASGRIVFYTRPLTDAELKDFEILPVGAHRPAGQTPNNGATPTTKTNGIQAEEKDRQGQVSNEQLLDDPPTEQPAGDLSPVGKPTVEQSPKAESKTIKVTDFDSNGRPQEVEIGEDEAEAHLEKLETRSKVIDALLDCLGKYK